jgi:hypothetical protein
LRKPSTVIACSPTDPTLKEKPGPKPGHFLQERTAVSESGQA